MRRFVSLVGVGVLLVATAVACNDDTIRFEGGAGPGGTPSTFVIESEGGAPSGAGGTDSGVSGSVGGGSGGGAPGGSNSGAEGGSETEGGSGDGSSGGDGAGSVPDDGGDGGGEAEPEPSAIDDRGRVGEMGTVLLRSDITQATIEIDTTPGEALTSQARAALQNQLAEHGGKSVSFVSGNTVPEQEVYTTDALRSIMESDRSNWSTGDRLGVYVMVLSGRHEDEGVVGVSFNSTAFAVFSELLGGGLLGLNYATYEEAVAVHELGHLFGLVNLTGQGAFHEDPSHKKHSANEGSVMYWAVESTVVGDVFSGGPPRDFDAEDEQEMVAIRQS